MALISSGPAANGAAWFESPGGYQRLFAFTGSLGRHPARLGKITWLQRRFESKILLASRKLISGEEFGADALEQARLIQQKAVSLQSETA
jgi:hypothetical protein